MLRKAIEKAFPLSPVPSGQHNLDGMVMVEHLKQLLVGKPWNQPTPDDYFSCSDGLLLLDDFLLHYYFPGYLLASLADNSESLFDRVLDFLTNTSWNFETCRASRLIEGLSEQQSLVLVCWTALDVCNGSGSVEAVLGKLEAKRWTTDGKGGRSL